MPDDLIGHIEDTRLTDALSERYLAYALSTIMSRSLPDVRDGLKPVHRRLIYAMQLLRLDPSAGFKKCARVVGDVIGKFHPHGDVAVYEALVRLAQDFAARYPLVEGQGNFGNIDGDNPAAMRYTEARLTEVARAMLSGIDEDAVDFRPTYDGEESEPIVLPGAFPNLLANGAAGIAVGMATSIPPHNAGEICAAAIHLVRNPQATAADLLMHMPGPDFPTGGVLVEDKASILSAYETGRGGFRLRAKWAVEKGKHGTWQIVVTEIPYQVQKAKLIEQIAQLLEERKLPLLGDVHDESTERSPAGAGTEDSWRRAGSADADAVPCHFAGDAFSAEHERAGCDTHATGDVAASRCCVRGWIIATRCWCGARGIGSRRSIGGSRSSTDICWSI